MANDDTVVTDRVKKVIGLPTYTLQNCSFKLALAMLL